MFNLPVSSSNLLLLVVFALFQGFLVILVFFFFVDKFFSSRKHRLEAYKLKEEAFKEAQDVLLRSQEQAKNIVTSAETAASQLIQSAETKAAELIKHTDIFSKKVQEEFSESLSTVLKDKVTLLGTRIDEAGLSMQKAVEDTKITTLVSLDKSINSYNSVLESNLADYKSVISTKIDTFSNNMNNQILTVLNDTLARVKTFENKHTSYLKDRSIEVIEGTVMTYVHQNMTNEDKEAAVLRIIQELSVTDLSGN